MSVSSQAPARPQSDAPLFPTQLTEVERHILQALQQIRFGTLEIVIHDSRVVQIEKSEKVRFDVKGKPLADALS